MTTPFYNAPRGQQGRMKNWDRGELAREMGRGFAQYVVGAEGEVPETDYANRFGEFAQDLGHKLTFGAIPEKQSVNPGAYLTPEMIANLNPEQQQRFDSLSRVEKLLATAERPGMFAADEATFYGMLEQITGVPRENFTLSEGQTRFQGGRQFGPFYAPTEVSEGSALMSRGGVGAEPGGTILGEVGSRKTIDVLDQGNPRKMPIDEYLAEWSQRPQDFAPIPKQAPKTSVTVVNNPDIQKSTKGYLERGITDMTALIDSLDQIAQFNPNWLDWEEKAFTGWLGAKDHSKFLRAAFGDLTDEQVSRVGDWATLVQSITRIFNEELKRMSGVAVNPTEFERMKKALPYISDSKTQFMAKLEQIQTLSRNARARLYMFRKRGVLTDDMTEEEAKAAVAKASIEYPLDSMDQVIANEVETVQRSFIAQGMSEQGAYDAAASRVRREYGL